MSSAATQAKLPQLAAYQWKPGQSGNPSGRPLGRQALETEFLKDLAQCWHEGGIDALNRAREKDPVAFVRVVASLMPRKLDAESLGGINRAEIRALIDLLRPIIAIEDARDVGQGACITGQAEPVPALPKTG